MLGTSQDEEKTLLWTPDLDSATVKSILCLFYTGKVNIGWDILGEVNNALKLLGNLVPSIWFFGASIAL